MVRFAELGRLITSMLNWGLQICIRFPNAQRCLSSRSLRHFRLPVCTVRVAICSCYWRSASHIYIHTYIHTYKHSYKYAYWPLRTWLWNCVLLLWYTNYTIAITNSAEICSLTPIFLMGVTMPASSLVDDLTRVSLQLLNEPVRAYVWSCHHWECVSCTAHTTGKTFCGVHDRRREYFWRLHKFAANCFHHN